LGPQSAWSHCAKGKETKTKTERMCVCTGIVVMTDGVVALPDTSLMELLLQQLHRDCISCSFIQLDRTHHMQRGFGFVPHPELLQFIALSTGGTYFPTKPRLVGLILCRFYVIFVCL